MDFGELRYWLKAVNEYHRLAVETAGGGH